MASGKNGAGGADIAPTDGQAGAAARAGTPAAASAEIRGRIHAAVGQVVLALSVVPRYRHQSLADLQTLVLEPLLRDKVAIATGKPGGTGEEAAGDGGLAGIAFWASVSDAVDAKIREQIKGGAFPIKLKPEEWASGERVWLLDVVAPSQKMASAVLANFRQVVKQGDVRIHPIVARQVDPELLKKMGAAVDAAG
jgi:cytolysin-activating lysine-acyltransferase